jgi:AcrR family transcriptional regulator
VAPVTPGPEAPDPRSPTRAKAGRTPSSTDGRSSRWEAHRVARREELIDAAVEAVREHGARAGMDQIAAAARTSKPVIYRYFADKNDLYRAISRRVVEQVLGTLAAVIAADPAPRELLHAGIDAYLGLLEDSPGLYRFVALHPLVGEPDSTEVTDFASAVASLLAGPLERHLADIGFDPALAHPWSESIVGFISAASLWWLNSRETMTREQLAEYLGSLLWGGAAGVYQAAGRAAEAAPAPGIFPPITR